MADIRSVHRYSKLLTKKIALEADLKAVNGEITDLTPAVLDYFQRQGIDQIASEGRVLYLRRELVTSKNQEFSTEQACECLEMLGLHEYIGARINLQGLSAYVREREQDGEEIKGIEEDLGGAFRIIELFKIGSRKKA